MHWDMRRIVASSHRDDSNKWSKTKLRKLIIQPEPIEVDFTHLILISDDIVTTELNADFIHVDSERSCG